MPPATTSLATLRHAVFARHSHPLSAWSRWATTPVLLVPVWTRSPRAALATAAWFALNPVMTPPPEDPEGFATRAMLGEEAWLVDSSLDPRITQVNAAGSVLLGASAIAAWRHRAVPAALLVTANMALTMYSWARFARIHDARRDERRQHDSPAHRS